MIQERITEFAKSQGYDDAEYIGKWHDYDCYEPYSNTENAVDYVGLPLLILVKDDKIRMSTAEEALKQIDESD